jgi:hypothetical protein
MVLAFEKSVIRMVWWMMYKLQSLERCCCSEVQLVVVTAADLMSQD